MHSAHTVSAVGALRLACMQRMMATRLHVVSEENHTLHHQEFKFSPHGVIPQGFLVTAGTARSALRSPMMQALRTTRDGSLWQPSCATSTTVGTARALPRTIHRLCAHTAVMVTCFVFGAVRLEVVDAQQRTWIQLGATISGVHPQQFAMSQDGSVIAVGDPLNDIAATNAGAVHVYERSGSTWTQRGSPILGLAAQDYCGRAVAISADGSMVAAASPSSDVPNPQIGSVRIFLWSSLRQRYEQWGSTISGEYTSDFSGSGLAMSANGNVVAIGAPGNDANGAFTSVGGYGHVRVYAYSSGAWRQRGGDIDGRGSSDQAGGYKQVALSADGFAVAVGATAANGGPGSRSGSTRVRLCVVGKRLGAAWWGHFRPQCQCVQCLCGVAVVKRQHRGNVVDIDQLSSRVPVDRVKLVATRLHAHRKLRQLLWLIH